ncbi:MAG TPA: DUF3842 family protein [Candidatus Scybalomonas excrementigallinarum]|jgi:hypothetical protein|nr:DUF3842 family protein [Candidatus Scybalomonas excrementigallinarum]
MRIVVIDGQGGGIGKSLVEQLKKKLPKEEILAIGVHSISTSNMLKAGADLGVTGENAIVYNCKNAKIITGPIGIIVANGLMGEITKEMAEAITASEAEKILIPVARCSVKVAGVQEMSVGKYVEQAVEMIKQRLEQEEMS